MSKIGVNHYYKAQVVKMGVWSLLPGDVETWHGEHTNSYFKQLFGIGKGLLLLNNLEDGFSHAYATKAYLKKLYTRIGDINKSDYTALAKKLKTFYPLVEKAKKEVKKNQKQTGKLSNTALAREFFRIRDWIHHLAIYDQFAWLAEDYWTARMDTILVGKLGLAKGSETYHQVLFALTRPENISTTLLEKTAVIEKSIAVKKRLESVRHASGVLAKKFGFMPVFCYGKSWGVDHYVDELQQYSRQNLRSLQQEYQVLRSYKKIRERDLKAVIEKYKIEKQDLQVFLDFGLAIDTRNEAEYFVSFGGFFLVPLYKEIAKRLYLSVKQLRFLYEKEMLDAISGNADATELLEKKNGWGSIGFDTKISKRINIIGKESKKLFSFIERHVSPVQGGDERNGLCANPGKAVGKARIVPSPEYNDRVNTGDILFTYSTTADYLPAMKRAAAIITEVGGLTCHAAVVSREFGIPCVVALTNAMKNFKDGELVEVNADIGAVKKL